jgi:hypothetical protein
MVMARGDYDGYRRCRRQVGIGFEGIKEEILTGFAVDSVTFAPRLVPAALVARSFT